MPDHALASRIDAVTVYREGALVRRVAEITRNGSFPSRVEIGDLPLSLDDGSVRVHLEAESKGESPPTATDVRVALSVPAPGEKPKRPEDEQIEALQTQENRLEERVEVVTNSIRRLRGMELPERPDNDDGDAPPPPPASPADGRLELITFQGERVRALLLELNRLTDELRDVRKQRKHLETQQQLASTADKVDENQVYKAVVVSLAEPAVPAQKARVILEYAVPGARWAPGYSLHFDRDMKSARLQVRAVVSQQTGEDWIGVPLALSTADPQSWTELPDLPSMRIGRRQSPVKSGWRAPPEGAEALFCDYDAFRNKAAAPVSEPEPDFDYDDEDEDDLDADAFGAGAGAGADAEKSEMLEDLLMESPEAEPPMEAMRMMSAPTAGAMPPPASAPPPAPPPAPKMSRKRAAAPAKMKKMADRRSTGVSPAASMAGLGELAEEDPFGASPESNLLNYGLLRMRPPGSSDRGSLLPVSRRETLMEVIQTMHVSIEFDIMTVVRAAVKRARSVSGLTPPSGFSAPRTEDNYDYAYMTDTPVDVLSDGTFRSVPVTGAAADVAMKFVVVPRESTDVYRFAEFTNPLEAPLLPGPADVYIDDNFLLTAPVRFVAPNGNAGLGLGVDQAIKVARNTHFEEETVGMLSGSLELRHSIDIEVVNNRGAAADVVVRERVPARSDPDDDDIAIEVTAEPSWKDYDSLGAHDGHEFKGAHQWDVTVEPGAKRKLAARYTITIPSKKEIVGGNRREA